MGQGVTGVRGGLAGQASQSPRWPPKQDKRNGEALGEDFSQSCRLYPQDWLGRLKLVHEQWWGDCYLLSPSPGPPLEEEEIGSPPKNVLSLTPLNSLGVSSQFPLPAKQLCWIHAATQTEDFPLRQHLLLEQCPAWLSGLPGRETSPFFLLFI